MPEQQTLPALVPSSGLTSLPPEAWRLLTDSASSAKETARLLARKPDLLAAVRQQAEALSERCRPADRIWLIGELTKLAPQMGLRDVTESDWSLIVEGHVEVLDALPAESVSAAIFEWKRRNPFFPKPSDLFALAEKHAASLRMAAYRAKLAIESAAPAAKAPISDDERQANLKMLRDLAAGIGSKTIPQPPPRPVPQAPEPVQPVVATEPEEEPEEVL